jgi:hypothetical protein
VDLEEESFVIASYWQTGKVAMVVVAYHIQFYQASAVPSMDEPIIFSFISFTLIISFCSLSVFFFLFFQHSSVHLYTQ